MVWFAMAAAGFGLLFLGDINSVSWKNRLLAPAFFCGFALIAAAAAGDLTGFLLSALTVTLFMGGN